MKLSNTTTRVILAVIILLSLGVSAFFLSVKQGYHEDELLTYNLANSSKQLNIGGWNTPGDMNEYLAVYPEHRFDYAQVVQNQIIDASHPPFYYALVHTVCSFFPEVFSKWLAFAINLAMMAGALLMLFRIGKRVTGSNLYALLAVGGYALSIACITTTIYLRMYASLTFFVLAFICLTLRFYEKKNRVQVADCVMLLAAVVLGILTQYYFILCAGLTGLVYLIFSIKEKNIKSLILYIVTALVGAGLALAIYPHIIRNVLGGNRGFGSLNFSVDAITIVTYVFYKLGTYVQQPPAAVHRLHGSRPRLRRLLPLRPQKEAQPQGVVRHHPRGGVFPRHLARVAVQQRPLRHGVPAADCDALYLRVHPDFPIPVPERKASMDSAPCDGSCPRDRSADRSAVLPLRQDQPL